MMANLVRSSTERYHMPLYIRATGCSTPQTFVGNSQSKMLSGTRSTLLARSLLRAARRPAGAAALHTGRATSEDTREFLSRSAQPPKTSPTLRIGGAETLALGRRGVGSPALWAKDVPRIDASKAVMSAFEGNFIQAAVNPFEASKHGDKQAYVEALVLQELVEELAIPREAFVVSALIGDSLLHPSPEGNEGVTLTYSIIQCADVRKCVNCGRVRSAQRAAG